VPPGSDDAVFAAEWPRVLAHLRKFKPEFILLQAGADSVEGDPITHMRFTADAMAALPGIWRRWPKNWGTAACSERAAGLQPHQPRAGLDGGRAGICRNAGKPQLIEGFRQPLHQRGRHIQYNSRPPEVDP
jgi:hypothetical protein